MFADTGFFYSTDRRVGQVPGNQLPTTTNGITVSPVDGTAPALLLGIDSKNVRAHSDWDAAQVAAFGTEGGTPAFGQGSAVAGSDTGYPRDSTRSTGPWLRIATPGAMTADLLPPTNQLRRASVPTAATGAGYDLTPKSPLAGGIAARLALGEARVRDPLFAEIAFRVLDPPLNPALDADVFCAEVFGAEPAPDADTAAWASFVPWPACGDLRLRFTVAGDRELALPGQSLTYTVSGQNRRTTTDTNAVVRLAYDPTMLRLQAAQGNPVTEPCGSRTCLRWNLGTVVPSGSYALPATFTVLSGGKAFTDVAASYTSAGLPGGGQAHAGTVLQPIPVLPDPVSSSPRVVNPGSSAEVGLGLRNTGTGDAGLTQLTVTTPPGWAVDRVTIAGKACNGPTPNVLTCPTSATLRSGGTIPVSVVVRVAATAPPGLYPLGLSASATAKKIPGTFETNFPAVATLAVGEQRSASPTIQCPSAADDAVTGTAPDGALVRVYFNGTMRAQATTTDGSWQANEFTSTFGSLYPGLEMRATAQRPGELESPLSTPCLVAA